MASLSVFMTYLSDVAVMCCSLQNRNQFCSCRQWSFSSHRCKTILSVWVSQGTIPAVYAWSGSLLWILLNFLVCWITAS